MPVKEFVALIQRLGLPVVFLLYYLIIEKPNSEAKYDKLLQNVVQQQIVCQQSLSALLNENAVVMNKLLIFLDSKK